MFPVEVQTKVSKDFTITEKGAAIPISLLLSVYRLKCEIASRPFQPATGLLRDCEIFETLYLKL